MLRWWVRVLPLAAAARPPPLAIEGVEVNATVLFPVGFTFKDQRSGEEKVLSEVSDCEFIDSDSLLLVGDSGELFLARVEWYPVFNVSLEWQIPLSTPQGFPDTEGLASSGREGTVLVSSEARPVGIVEFDWTTGRPVTNASFYEVPPVVLEHFVPQPGLRRSRGTGSWLVSTTEGAITLDPTGHHRIFLWDAENGGLPKAQVNYSASRWAEANGKAISVCEIERIATNAADDDALSVLTLERGYSSDLGTNLIRIFEVDLRFQHARKTLLVEWAYDVLRSVADGGEFYNLTVDNYEGMCLTPDGSGLLLVNDDNLNPSQIGTQFVLLDLLYYPYPTSLETNDDASSCDRRSRSRRDTLAIALLAAALGVSSLSVLFLLLGEHFRRRRRRGAGYHPSPPSDGGNNLELRAMT